MNFHHCPTRRQVLVPPVLKSIFIFRTLTPNVYSIYIFHIKIFFINFRSTVGLKPLFFEWTMVWSAAAYRKLYLAGYILLPIYKKRPLKEFDPMWHLCAVL